MAPRAVGKDQGGAGGARAGHAHEDGRGHGRVVHTGDGHAHCQRRYQWLPHSRSAFDRRSRKASPSAAREAPMAIATDRGYEQRLVADPFPGMRMAAIPI